MSALLLVLGGFGMNFNPSPRRLAAPGGTERSRVRSWKDKFEIFPKYSCIGVFPRCSMAILKAEAVRSVARIEKAEEMSSNAFDSCWWNVFLIAARSSLIAFCSDCACFLRRLRWKRSCWHRVKFCFLTWEVSQASHGLIFLTVQHLIGCSAAAFC